MKIPIAMILGYATKSHHLSTSQFPEVLKTQNKSESWILVSAPPIWKSYRNLWICPYIPTFILLGAVNIFAYFFFIGLGSTAKLMHASKFQVSRLIIHTTYLDSLERLQKSNSSSRGFRSFDFFFNWKECILKSSLSMKIRYLVLHLCSYFKADG